MCCLCSCFMERRLLGRKEGGQAGLWGFTPGFTDSARAESSCALFTPVLGKGNKK